MDGERAAPEPAANHEPQIAELISIVNQARSLASALDNVATEAAEKRAAADGALQKIEGAVNAAYSKLDEVTAAVEEAQKKLTSLQNEIDERGSALREKADHSANEANAKVGEVAATVTNAQTTIQQILTELHEKKQTRLAELDAAAQQSAARLSEAQASAVGAGEHHARAKQLLSEVETTKVEVVAHHSVTSEALASKERFERDASGSLQQFNANVATANERQRSYEQNAAAFEDEIKRLTGEAEKMLYGATNAGLASSYKDEMRAIERSMRWDEVKFVLGIGLLALSMFPLYGYMRQVTAGHELSVGSVAFRTAFLIPAVWFCYHYGRKIAASFELRHNYAHKSALAASMEAFKKQAEGQGPEVVQAVFEQLLKNPASILRRHRKMGDGPAEAAADATKPLVDEVRKLLPKPDWRE